ncbi:MAG: hypothetical protein WCD76_13735 [Pyrinomonadaceae bacterium]
MRRDARLNIICGGILLAALGVVLAWNTFADAPGDAFALHAETGLRAAASQVRRAGLTSLAGSMVMILVGLGLFIFALLRDRRIK